jgi:hypothetical protein
MTDIDLKRATVADLYPGPGWKAKVGRMTDNQVVAIYLREKAKQPTPYDDKPKPKEESNDDTIPF